VSFGRLLSYTLIPAAELSPASYLLYFKRATAHLSLSRHEPALADFDKVLELTGGTFDKALLSKGKIFAKEGRWVEARDTMKAYSRKNIGDRVAGDLVRWCH
jgi:DnaJ homolog subfamily C member 3